MTEEQLQLLRAARLSGKDEHDAAVAAARAAAAEDPAWEAHLAEERSIDEAMRSALNEIEPPAGLEESLLAAMRAARAPQPQPVAVVQPQHVQRAGISRRNWIGWIGAAAASVAVGSAWWWKTANAFTMKRLSAELAAITKNGVTLTVMSMDTKVVVGWMLANNAPRADKLPDALDALGRKGCHIYDIAGHRVSLECFLLPGMRELHLFSVPSSDLDDAPPDGSAAKVTAFEGRTLATWTRGGATMLLFSQESEATIRALV